MRLPTRPLAALAVLMTASALVVGCGGSSSSSSTQRASSTPTPQTPQSSSPAIGYEGIPLEQGPELAPAGSTEQGSPVDGIECGATEQLSYHIHAHLAVYVQGQPRSLPAGIGIPGALVQQSQFGPVVGQGVCFYWLHTHTSDGVVHIESPTSRVYSLGDFFDEWRQPLSANQVGPYTGKVTTFVSGKPWSKDPRTVPLDPHVAVQLDVGSPVVPFQPVSFAGTQL